MPDEVARLLFVPRREADSAKSARLLCASSSCSARLELAAARKEIDALRKPPEFTTTLVMQERPTENPRPTFIHNRGEFLQPTDRVEPGVLSIAGPLPPGMRRTTGLGFARWLVSPDRPRSPRG